MKLPFPSDTKSLKRLLKGFFHSSAAIRDVILKGAYSHYLSAGSYEEKTQKTAYLTFREKECIHVDVNKGVLEIFENPRDATIFRDHFFEKKTVFTG